MLSLFADETAFLGHDLLVWIVLAFGAAMVVGYGAALLRPTPPPKRKGELQHAPVGRSVLMICVGSIATVWALATLIH